MTHRRNPWPSLGFQAWKLGMDASAVIGLRTMKIAAGGAAGRAEVRRMVQEKLDAAVALQGVALTGGLGLTPASATAKTLKHYSKRVSANRRRLSKG